MQRFSQTLPYLIAPAGEFSAGEHGKHHVAWSRAVPLEYRPAAHGTHATLGADWPSKGL